MAHQFFLDKRPHYGLTFAEYFNIMEIKANTQNLSDLSEEERITIEQVKLNYQRSSRIMRTHKLNENLFSLVKELEFPTIMDGDYGKLVWGLCTKPSLYN